MLNWYDYGAWFYDPQIARLHSVDLLAEWDYNWPPYRYGFNNPFSFMTQMVCLIHDGYLVFEWDSMWWENNFGNVEIYKTPHKSFY